MTCALELTGYCAGIVWISMQQPPPSFCCLTILVIQDDFIIQVI